jgi:glycerol-3-phosphate dehydrogenase
MSDQDRFFRDGLVKLACDESVGWDVIVIGGGASGLATAWDAVSRGLRVALLERSDFSKATSSRSTKLVHGGVRYLQKGDVGLVKEALNERKLLLENAPEFAQPLRFVLPTTHFLGRYYYRFGMLLYDLLAGKAGIERAELLSEGETRERLPGICLDNLKGGVGYSDAQFDDAALSIAMAQAICAGGSLALNYVSVDGLLTAGRKVIGAKVKDTETGREWEMRAKVVINATGIFSNQLRGENAVKPQWTVRTSRGSHLVCPRRVMDGDHGMIIPKTQDGRVLFAIPWKQHVVIGTTDVPTDEPVYDPKPTADEVGFILDEAGKALGVTASDVTSQWSGLRPLVSRSSTKSTAALSRKHIIEVSPEGLVSVLGGKWTTCRKMGQDAIDSALKLGVIKAGESKTAARVLTEHGARVPRGDLLGASVDEFAEGEVRARVEEACRFGFARTLEDVLTRRMRVLQLNASAAVKLAPVVAGIMAGQLGWSPAEAARRVEAFSALAEDYLPGS